MSETVSARRLARETSAVLSELESSGEEVLVTRDGVEVARLVPLSPVERAWRAAVRAAGVDPDDPDWLRGDDAVIVAELAAGQRSLSEALRDQRELETF